MRANPEAVRDLRIGRAGGSSVPLSAVANVAMVPALSEITREGGSRKIDVTCNVRGRDLGSVARDIRGAAWRPAARRRVSRRGARRVRRAAGGVAAAAAHVGAVAAAGLSAVAHRLRRPAAGGARVHHAAVRAGGRRGGGVPVRRRALARIARRPRHGDRHRRAERHHAGQSLPASRDGRKACRSAATW